MGENYFGITDTGRQRTNNEDSFIAQTVSGDHFIIACVIDGVGGYAGGEIAAQLTRVAIIDQLEKLGANITDQLVAALANANERIIKEKEVNPENEKMACVVTLAMVNIEKNVCYFAHVGDTRLYLFRDGSLIKLTRDHSTVGFLEESGRLTEEAAMLHPKRNEVNKVLGYDTQMRLTKDFIDTGESPFLPGDTILVCSDGLTDMVPASLIIAALTTGDDLASKGRHLIKAANEAGGKDNITVVLVHNNKSPLHHTVAKPLISLKKNNGNGAEEPKIAEQDTHPGEATVKSSGIKEINRLLLFFCIIFLSGFLWLLIKNYNADKENKKLPVSIIPVQKNQQEINLLQSIRASSGNIVQLTAGQTIVISDTVLIENDSLHIIGNGASFVRDPAYSGPAFILSPSCKYILFDSLGIRNFDIGILVLNKGLHLKNIQFKNCLLPLQFQQQLSQDTTVSGNQADTVFYHTGPLAK